MAQPGATGTSEVNRDAKSTVVRNTAFLVVAQLLSMPLSVSINAVLARKLGPVDFGYIFLANNFIAFGFLLVEWGQPTALTALIARDRSLAGTALGTSIAWRVAAAAVVYGALVVIAKLLHYEGSFQVVLGMLVIAKIFSTICGACLDMTRGLERSSPSAVSIVRYNLISVSLLVPILYTGGGLKGALIALICADLINTAFVWKKTLSLGIERVRLERHVLIMLLRRGSTFMLFAIGVNIQPFVDTTMLSAFATPQVLAWQGAAAKLVGVLIFPVSALTAALYPTLCRLYHDDIAEYRKLVAAALRGATILVVPVALGTGLFPELGIMIFGERSFGPAEQNLRILSCFVFLLYFTMVLGISILAAGRERIWTGFQFSCVAVSAIVDPILIPWFQRHWGNGGLGVCVATVSSEIVLLLCGLTFLPSGVLDRGFVRDMGRAVIAGVAMAVTALISAKFNPFIGATLSLIAYGVTIYAVGGIDPNIFATLNGIVRSKLGRG
jgi:O-antigen/teichoic acid export membrane protein